MMVTCRCRSLVLAVAAVGVLAGGARAQRRGAAPAYPVAEIGTQAIGIVRLSQGGYSSTHLAIPGGEVETLPTLYAAFFLSPRLALEPALTYQHHSAGGSSSWVGAGLLRLGGYFSGARQDSPFLYGELGVLSSDDSGQSDIVRRESHAGFGLGGGYRWLVSDGRLALRLEGRARRWTTDPDLTELGLALAGGVVLGRAR